MTESTMVVIMFPDMSFLKAILHYVRERVRYLSLTSTAYFVFREVVNMGPFRKLMGFSTSTKERT